MRLWFLGHLYWLYWVLSECVSGLFMSVVSVLSVNFSLVFSSLHLERLLSECVILLVF